jgi:hypothetical protein
MACRTLGFIDYEVTLSGVCTNPGKLNIYIDEITPGVPTTGDTLFQLSNCTDPAPDGYYILDSNNPNDVYVVSGGSGNITSLDTCSTFSCRSLGAIEYSNTSINEVCNNPLSDAFSISESNFGVPNIGDTVFQVNDCITTASDGFYKLDINSPDNVYVVTGGDGEITSIESCVNQCPPISFNISITGETYCIGNNGSASVNNISGGTPPYTFTWSNSLFTGDTLTGLSSNSYIVTVTDASGCTQTESFFIPVSDVISITNITTSLADCFSCNGQTIINFIGGEPPYSIIGTNGQTGFTSSNTFTFTNLCAGFLGFQIIDNRGCSLNSNATVSSSAGFSIVSISSTNSTCSQGGSVSIQISAPAGLYTYTLTAQTTNNVSSVVTTSQSHTFTNLSSDTYNVGILGNDIDCFFTDTITILNEDSFSLDITTTESLCNINGGTALIEILSTDDSPVYPVDYIVTNQLTNNVVFNSLNTVLSAQTVTNLGSGTYEVSVIDNNGCELKQSFSISNLPGISMNLKKTDCVLGNDGKVFVYIFDGVAPFELEWDPNVTPVSPNPFGQDGLYLDNLSEGTYTLTVTDYSGCTSTQSVFIDCSKQTVSCYELFEVCDSEFETTVGNKRTIYSMLNETFNSASSGQTNCIIENAVFTTNIIVTGSTVYSALTDTFYTGYTLNDVPTDEQWVESIKTLLNPLINDGKISDYTIDLDTNRLSISSNCNLNPDPFSDVIFNLSLDIDININCVDNS